MLHGTIAVYSGPAPLVRRRRPQRCVPVAILRIHTIVARAYGISEVWMSSESKEDKLVFPRQVAMYLARKHTKWSYPEIARCFGGKHHTTVLYAVKKITRLMEILPELRDQVAELARAINIEVPTPALSQAPRMPQWVTEMRAQQEEILELLRRRA